MQRLEQKIREMEGNLDDEQRRLVENQKHHRRIERRVKELTFQQVSCMQSLPLNERFLLPALLHRPRSAAGYTVEQ